MYKYILLKFRSNRVRLAHTTVFFAIIFIAIGLALLLNSLGWFVGMWQIFWGIIFLAVGIRMCMKQGGCPMCEGHIWKNKMVGKMHDHGCDCEHECEEKPRANKKK